MRLLWSILPLQPGEFVITKPYVSQVDVGKLRLTVESISSFTSVFGVMSDLVSVNPDAYVYVLAPHKDPSGVTGVFEDVERNRIAWVLFPSGIFKVTPPIPDVCGLSLPVDLFSTRHRLGLPIDAVIGGSPFFAKRPSVQLSQVSRAVPGIVRHESSYGPRGNVVEPWGQPGNNRLMQETMLSSSLGIRHVFLNESTKGNFIKLFLKEQLSASALRRFDQESRTILNGVNTELLDSWLQEEGGLRYNRGKSAGSFYALLKNKGTEEVLGLYQKMAMAGQLDRVVVTWGGDNAIEEGLPETNKTVPSQFEFCPKSSRRSYLKKAMTVAAALFNSNNETSPISPIECAYVGCIPLVPDKPWVRGLPKGWPLVYRSLDEAHSMLLHAIENQEEYAKLSREYAAAHYRSSERGPEFMRFVAEVVAESNKIVRMTDAEFLTWNAESPFSDVLRQKAKGKDELTWEEVASIPRPHTRLGTPIITNNDLPELVRRVTGMRDNLSSPTPTFRRI